MAIIVPTVVHDPIRLAVLVSGGGTTLANLADGIRRGELHATIAAIICSNRKSQQRVQQQGYDAPVHLIERKAYETPAEFSDVVFNRIRDADTDLVCLAGFLSLLTIPDDFILRIVNIHPALLPAFGGKGMYGQRVHEAVLAAGVKVSGCTVHFADQTYDTGPIIAQRTSCVEDDDTPETLAERVFEQECRAYPNAIRLIGEARVSVHGRVTRIERSDLISCARRVCMQAHHGQTRANGEPYSQHPLAVAEILRLDCDVRDEQLLAAACLHDVVEDTDWTVRRIERKFGPRVARIVDQMTLPDDPDRSFEQKHAELAEHARRMDDDTKLVKLADRLHNLTQLEHRDPRKRPRYAAATEQLLEAMAPWPREAEPLIPQVRHWVERHSLKPKA